MFTNNKNIAFACNDAGASKSAIEISLDASKILKKNPSVYEAYFGHLFPLDRITYYLKKQ
tara:strand:- start:77 stop:256 length:180 start_codon:yes stop_codon:yes gene_type:complete